VVERREHGVDYHYMATQTKAEPGGKSLEHLWKIRPKWMLYVGKSSIRNGSLWETIIELNDGLQ
jgi:hypothetical protein